MAQEPAEWMGQSKRAVNADCPETRWKQALGLSSGESDKGVVIDAISSRFISECAPSRRNPDRSSGEIKSRGLLIRSSSGCGQE